MKHLVILTALTVGLDQPGHVRLTRKFKTGVEQYLKYWPGRVTVLMEPGDNARRNLDHEAYATGSLPFAVEAVQYDDEESLARHLRTATVALGSGTWRQTRLSQLCRRLNVPCIYVTEYSLLTRRQAIDATTPHPIRRLRRHLWEFSLERKLRAAIGVADGVQCNGTPTYEAYRNLNRQPLLYFDTRVRNDMLASASEVRDRSHPGPLRLLFSGRLIAIKGADHILEVAGHLNHLGVSFEMKICGDGDLVPSMRDQIRRHQLENHVEMVGVLDFESELVPLVKSWCDLFICCHRQGDPSCTYLETYACGVPIVGYDNEAFAGVAATSNTGWVTPMDRPLDMAKEIARLDAHRDEITDHARRSLTFADAHTFEKTFERRVQHLLDVADASPN